MNLICSSCRRPVAPQDLDFTFGKKEWSNGRVFWPGDAEYETKCCRAEVLNNVPHSRNCTYSLAFEQYNHSPDCPVPLTDDQLETLYAEGRRLNEEAGIP